MKHKEGDPPYVYLYIHSKLRELTQFSPFIQPRPLIIKLKRIIQVPKILHYPILAQMEEYGLIKRINQQKYRVLASRHEKILPGLRKSFFWD